MSNRKSSSSGCFSAVLRRILCSGSPQTHPSDHIVESKTNEFVVGEAKVQVQASSESVPGIVARLMGLDSLPDNNWVHKGKTTGPVTRSRSVNFMDYMLEYDLTQAKHRRVKTSASFREVPQCLLQNQNQEFLVVYLDKNKEVAEFKPTKSEKGEGSRSKHNKQKENVREKVVCKKQNQEKNMKISKLKNEPRRVCRSCINGGKDVKIKHGSNSKSKSQSVPTSNKKKVNQVEYYSGNSSENSSPVSVLSLNDFDAQQENDIAENYESHTTDIGASMSVTEGKSFESTDIEELVEKPWKLTAEDVQFSNWIKTKKVFTYEDFEEICFEFGEQMLDLMLYQVADELVGINSDDANY